MIAGPKVPGRDTHRSVPHALGHRRPRDVNEQKESFLPVRPVVSAHHPVAQGPPPDDLTDLEQRCMSSRRRTGTRRAAGPPELYRRRYGDSEGTPEDL